MPRFIAQRLTARLLCKGLFVAILCGGIAVYIGYQARHLVSGPQITLLDTLSTVQHDGTITLHGMTENITALTLNGKPVFTDEHGAFEQTLVLENGYTIMTLHARDRYGRNTSHSRPFVYTPQQSIN